MQSYGDANTHAQGLDCLSKEVCASLCTLTLINFYLKVYIQLKRTMEGTNYFS